ncbi:MAG TPA: TusE/DsrC/DsvC family sulfur relay protein [Burkholderiaceae bacterium]|nr:TusE/DsrC/DsvC family sulfur relay protein [Burkholderiaceae bacterium]
MIPQTSSPTRARAPTAPIGFDEDGFLLQTENWSPALAQELAREAGVSELTAKHWEVIDYVRDRYFAIGALPVMRLVCRAAGLDPKNAHRLFSSCRSLWRIAGLPNPGEEAKAYMN